MPRLSPLSIALVLASAICAWGAGERPADEVRPRVEHHLREVEHLAQQFETVLGQPCPAFASREEWSVYADGQVDRVVMLVAHLDQAWVEAKQTGDKDVRREAKAPRQKVDRAQQLLQKLQACANGHGASFTAGSVWQRVEREAPRRQREIALPR
jgi:hypothetical protein